MYNHEMNFKTKDFKIIILGIIVLLAIISVAYFFTMQYNVDAEKRVGASINKSGKQRMLSQKILAYSYVYISEPKNKKKISKKLLNLTQELKHSNEELINGTKNLTSALELSDKFYNIYYKNPVNINKKIEKYINEVDKLLKDKPKNLNINNIHLENIKKLSQPLLKSLDLAVKEYETIAINSFEIRITIRYIHLFLTLLLLFLLYKFILLPLIITVKKREDELIQKEKFSNIIIESNENAIIAINSKSEVIVFNSAAEKMFGYSKEQMLKKDSLYRIIPDEYLEIHKKASKNFLSGGKSMGLVNNTHKMMAKRSNGDIFDIKIGFGEERYKNEIIVVTNIIDITDDIKALNKIKSLNQELQRSIETEKNFLASISHEIRTPLNSIIGFLELLEEANIQGEEGEWIKRANISSVHLLDLINDVLDVSKITAKQMELAHEKINLERVLQESAVIISSRISKDVEFSFNSCGIDSYVFGDSARIKQILLNLLGNAAKFTKKGKIELNLKELNKIDDKKVEVVIDVCDTGKGISEDKQQHIFGAFKQSSAKDKGTGLGLFISKSLSEMMNGSISVKSKLGVGTTFTTKLILDIDKEKIINNEKPQSKRVISSDFSHLKILLADDVKMNIALSKAIFLKNFNVKFTEANNGLEVVEMVKNNKFDIIFMDVQMPIMDGLEATKQIRNFNKDIPIIAMTANAYAEHKDEVLKAGMNGYITKPISKIKIEEILQSYS